MSFVCDMQQTWVDQTASLSNVKLKSFINAPYKNVFIITIIVIIINNNMFTSCQV